MPGKYAQRRCNHRRIESKNALFNEAHWPSGQATDILLRFQLPAISRPIKLPYQ
jgi:hypothetical protein